VAGHPPQTVQHVKYLRKHESESSNIEMSLVGVAPTGGAGTGVGASVGLSPGMGQ